MTTHSFSDTSSSTVLVMFRNMNVRQRSAYVEVFKATPRVERVRIHSPQKPTELSTIRFSDVIRRSKRCFVDEFRLPIATISVPAGNSHGAMHGEVIVHAESSVQHMRLVTTDIPETDLR